MKVLASVCLLLVCSALVPADEPDVIDEHYDEDQDDEPQNRPILNVLDYNSDEMPTEHEPTDNVDTTGEGCSDGEEPNALDLPTPMSPFEKEVLQHLQVIHNTLNGLKAKINDQTQLTNQFYGTNGLILLLAGLVQDCAGIKKYLPSAKTGHYVVFVSKSSSDVKTIHCNFDPKKPPPKKPGKPPGKKPSQVQV